MRLASSPQEETGGDVKHSQVFVILRRVFGHTVFFGVFWEPHVCIQKKSHSRARVLRVFALKLIFFWHDEERSTKVHNLLEGTEGGHRNKPQFMGCSVPYCFFIHPPLTLIQWSIENITVRTVLTIWLSSRKVKIRVAVSLYVLISLLLDRPRALENCVSWP